MEDNGSKGMGKAAGNWKDYGGESSCKEGILFPGPKPGSVKPKARKHVSTMMGEKIGNTVTSMFKNDKNKIMPKGQQ